MHFVLTLLRPRIFAIKMRSGVKNNRSVWGRTWLLGAIGLLIWVVILGVSLRVLNYVVSIEQLGDLLAYKLLSIILVTIFSLLIFSNIITSLSKLYISRDIALVLSMPVKIHHVFIARWIESLFDSSWMVVIFTLPVFFAYGIVFQAGAFYYGLLLFVLLLLSLCASCISVMFVMIAVIIIPANRIRSIFIFLGLLLFIGLYLAFRMMKPERLVDPEVFATTLFYIKSLSTPSAPYLPSTWAYDSLKAGLHNGVGQVLFHVSILFVFSVMILFFSILLAETIYYKGVSKTQAAQVRFIRYSLHSHNVLFFLPGHVRAFLIKETKHFFRDQTQWSQLFLLGALVIIYIYNFSVLPLERSPIQTVYLQNMLSFLNMGLAAFVLTAITARFAYPAVSLEGDSFWIVRNAPISKETYLWIKFVIYFLPLLLITEILIVATNLLLDVTPFMMMLSVVTMVLVVPGVVALGIGLGAAYPDFKSENPVQAVTSYGGFLFMVCCTIFVGSTIVLEAGPVYRLFMAEIHRQSLSLLEWLWIGASFFAVLVISIAVVLYPMKFGVQRLNAA